MFLHFIELKKCPVLEEKTLNRLQKWIKYLSAKSPAGDVQTEGDEIFEQLRRIEQMFVKDKEEMLRYEAAERFRLDYNSAIKGATEEGIEKGIKIGEEIGEKIMPKELPPKCFNLANRLLKLRC